MKFKMLLMVLILVIFTGCSSNQATESNKLNVTIEDAENLNSYQRDFIYLLKVLEDSHPNIYENFPKEEFDADRERLLAEFENVTEKTEYHIKLQQMVAKIGDSHTGIIMNNLFHSEKKYPINFHWIKDDLYIINTDKKMPEKWIGAKVIQFEKFSVEETVNICGSIISAENEIWKKTQLTNYFRNPDFLKILKISKSADSLCLTILINDKEEEITLFSKKKTSWRKNPPTHEITGKNSKHHSYKIFDDYKAAYYQFNSMLTRESANYILKNMLKWYERPLGWLFVSRKYPKYKNFARFLEKMYAEMNEKNVEKLIIDLRYNGGGSSVLGDLVIYHCDVPDTIQCYSGGATKISELYRQTYESSYNYYKNDFLEKNPGKEFTIPVLIKNDRQIIDDNYSFFATFKDNDSNWRVSPPKNKFKGRLILLIGSDTFSSASDFATTLCDNEQAILIGEPIGQKPTSFGDLLFITLPETKTKATVSHKLFQRPDSSKDNDPTLYPDIEIYPTIEEYLNGKDPVFEKAVGL